MIDSKRATRIATFYLFIAVIAAITGMALAYSDIVAREAVTLEGALGETIILMTLIIIAVTFALLAGLHLAYAQHAEDTVESSAFDWAAGTNA